MCSDKLKTAMQVWSCIAVKRAVKEQTITQMGIAKCYADRYNILVAQLSAVRVPIPPVQVRERVGALTHRYVF